MFFWYDENSEFLTTFNELDLPEIEKRSIKNNEYALKYEILKEHHKKRYLLYSTQKRPENVDNWLLDVLLSHTEFRADQISIWLADLNLGLEHTECAESHKFFFKSKVRLDKLKNKLKPHVSRFDLELNILAVCTQTE